MQRIETAPRVKKSVIVIGFLALLLAVSGLLSVRNGVSHMATAAVTESREVPVKALAEPVVEPAVRPGSKIAPKPAAPIEKKTEVVKTIGTGEASYYGPGFAGRPTANGERFNPAEMTAAHRTLPFGTKVKVTNQSNGRSVVVRINDRGPYAHNRVIDLSKGAAGKIGMLSSGTAQVKIEKVS